MTTDFRVMPWLRELRDRNAAEEHALTIEERLRRTRDGARDFHQTLLNNHPETKVAAAATIPSLHQNAVQYFRD